MIIKFNHKFNIYNISSNNIKFKFNNIYLYSSSLSLTSNTSSKFIININIIININLSNSFIININYNSTNNTVYISIDNITSITIFDIYYTVDINAIHTSITTYYIIYIHSKIKYYC